MEEKLEDRLHRYTTIDVAGVGPTTKKGPPLNIAISLSASLSLGFKRLEVQEGRTQRHQDLQPGSLWTGSRAMR